MSTQKKKGNPVTEFLRGKKYQLTGTLFFPHLLQPKVEPNKSPKYGCMIAWDKRENQAVIQEITGLFQYVKNTFHPQMPIQNWVNPIKDYDTTRTTKGEMYPQHLAGKCWLNASNNEKFPPQVMLMDQQAPNGMRSATPMDSMQLFDGQKIVVSISFFGLDGENMKYGVSTNLDAVLVVGGGERMMMTAGVDANEAFSSFLGMMGQNAPAQGQQAPQQQQYNPSQYQQPAQTHQAPQGNAPAGQGTFQNGQMHPGNQTQNYQQGGYGQNAPQTASPSNGQPQQNYYQQGQYNNGYNNGNGGGLV